ncbi:hypothetical protein Tco_0798699 [Tanacetum coccineum]
MESSLLGSRRGDTRWRCTTSHRIRITLGLPMQPVDPPSPNYVPGPEHPSSPDYVPSPEHPPSPIEIPYVPEPEYPEYLVPSDDEEPMEDQPLPTDASPGAYPRSVPVFAPEGNPEEDSRRSIGPLRLLTSAPTLDHLRSGYPLPIPVSVETEDCQTCATAAAIKEAHITEHAAAPTPPLLEIRESSAAGAARQPRPTPEVDTWDEIVEAMMDIAPTTLEGVDQEEWQHIEAHVRTLEAQVTTLITQTTSLQTRLTSALGRIATLETRDPKPQDGPTEAGSSS